MNRTITKTICSLALFLTHLVPGVAQQDLDDMVVGKYRILNSKILDQDRMLYVKLPDGYEESKESYPVLFQLYSHFQSAYYLPAVRTTNLMHRNGESPGVIVVGVKNHEFRYRDLLPVNHHQATSEIDNFLHFFEEELVPFIDQNYRTNGYKILAGPQAGAAFGIYSLAKKPTLFNAYFLTSPFWINSARKPLLDSLRQGLEQNNYANTFLMVTYKDHLGEVELNYLDTLSQMLIGHSTIEYLLNPIDRNSDFTAPVGIIKAMKTLFKDYKFPGTDTPQELESIELYYQELSIKYGFEIKIPEHGLVYEGDKFMSADELEKAKKIFHKMDELYPNGLMGPDRLGTIAFKQKEFNLAIEYYEKFLEGEPDNPYALSMINKIKLAKGK